MPKCTQTAIKQKKMQTNKRGKKGITRPSEKFFNLFSMNRITITLGLSIIYKNLWSVRFFCKNEREKRGFEVFLQHVAIRSVAIVCVKLHIFNGVICYRLSLCAKGFRVPIKRFSLHLLEEKRITSNNIRNRIDAEQRCALCTVQQCKVQQNNEALRIFDIFIANSNGRKTRKLKRKTKSASKGPIKIESSNTIRKV